jgi:RloB-like protein
MKRLSIPQSPSLNRRVGHVKPLSRIVAFCEGKTEKRYLDAFANHAGRRLFEAEFVKQVGVPSTVVYRCIEKKSELDAIAKRKSADSFDRNFSVWAVFDRDEHPCYAQAIQTAHQNGIRVAFSNPCIELWAFLHLETYGDRYIGRHEIQKLLKLVMLDYDHARSPVFNFAQMQNKHAFARGQAISMMECRLSLDDPYGCPATSMFELTDLIMASARPPAERKQKVEELRTRLTQIERDPQYQTGSSSLARERSNILTLLHDID